MIDSHPAASFALNQVSPLPLLVKPLFFTALHSHRFFFWIRRGALVTSREHTLPLAMGTAAYLLWRDSALFRFSCTFFYLAATLTKVIEQSETVLEQYGSIFEGPESEFPPCEKMSFKRKTPLSPSSEVFMKETVRDAAYKVHCTVRNFFHFVLSVSLLAVYVLDFMRALSFHRGFFFERDVQIFIHINELSDSLLKNRERLEDLLVDKKEEIDALCKTLNLDTNSDDLYLKIDEITTLFEKISAPFGAISTLVGTGLQDVLLYALTRFLGFFSVSSLLPLSMQRRESPFSHGDPGQGGVEQWPKA